MNKTHTPTATGLPVHESTRMRTAVMTDETGRRGLVVESSALSMRWLAGELQISHRYTKTNMQAARSSARSMRRRE